LVTAEGAMGSLWPIRTLRSNGKSGRANHRGGVDFLGLPVKMAPENPQSRA
jgi:hypothetical protein